MQIKFPWTTPLEVDCAEQRRIIPHVLSLKAGLLPMLVGGLLLCTSLACALLPSPLLALALFAAIFLAGAMQLRPRLALLLLFACTGLPSFALPLPGYHIHLTEPLTLLLPVVAILHRPTLRPGIPHLLALLFLGLAVLSFIHVPVLANEQSPYGADKRLLTLLIVFTAFFAGTWLAREVRHPSAFLSMLLVVSLPLYGIALAQALGIPLAPPLISAPDLHAQSLQDIQSVQGRLWGPFPWPVNFGMFLINLFAVALACWLQGTRRTHRMLGCLMACITVLTIVSSGTRSAMIAASIILIIACLLTRRLGLLCGIVLLTTLIGTFFYDQALALFNHDATSTDNRLLIWNEAIRLIKNNPWLGVGLEAFPYYYKQLIVGSASALGTLGIHPHEQYLEWALESGIPWLLCGVSLLLSILSTCWQAYRQLPTRRKCLQLAALLAVLANGIIGLFDVPLDQLEGATFLFLLAGLAVGQARNYTSNETKPTPERATTIPTKIEQPSKDNNAVSEQSSEDRPDAQKTGRAIALQLFSWGIALPLIFPVTALLAHYLGPEQYGAYSLTFPFLTFFALLGGTGMDPLIVRLLSRQPRGEWGKTLSYAAGTRTISILLCVIAAIVTACLLPISAEQRNLFWLGSITLFFSFSFNGLRFIYTHGFRTEQRIGLLSILEPGNRMITAVLIVLVIWWRWPLLLAYALLVYSDLPLFLLQVLLASKRYTIRIRFSLTHFRTQMLASLPLLGHQALTLLAGLIDQCILLVVAGTGPVGLYALASRVVDPLISIAFAYVNGLYPLLCTTFEEGRQQFANACYHTLRLLALAVVPLAVCITTQAELIVSVLGGKDFLAATGAVQLLIWAMALTFLNQVADRACTAANRERRIPLVTALATGANLVLNILLIPRWQIIGAGTANLLSEGCAFCLFLLLLKPHIRLKKTIGMLCRVLLSNVPALALLLWQHTLSPLLSLPLSLLSTGILYFVMRILTWNDLRQAQQLFFSLRKKKSASNEQKQRQQSREKSRATQHWELADYPTLVMPRIHP